MTAGVPAAGGPAASGLAAGVVRGLTDQIVSGRRRPGDRLPTEAELGTEYGVSRTVVREALSRLQAAGLVESVRGKGSFVLARPQAGVGDAGRTPRSADEERELWELRLALEVAIASWAARRRSVADLDRLRRAQEAFAGAGERPGEAWEADRAFHRALASASGNTRFVVALDSLGSAMIMMPRNRLQGDDVRARHHHAAAEHAAIVAAVAAADPDLAAAAVRLHLTGSRQRLLAD